MDEEDINLYLDSDCKDVCYGVDLFIGEPNYWNKGIGTEVMKKVIGYLVSDKIVELHTVEVYVGTDGDH